MVRLLIAVYALCAVLVLRPMDENNGVHNYKPERDQEAVRAIAEANIAMLASGFDLATPEARKSVCEDQVMDYFKGSPDDTRVFLQDGKVTGFATYYVALPWYRRLCKSAVGANAVLQHVAVDGSCRGKGYGKRLVQAVLDDCRKRNVNRVSLWTGPSMEYFYQKSLGFNLVRWTKLHEYNYAMRLRPHPLVEFLGYVRKCLRK